MISHFHVLKRWRETNEFRAFITLSLRPFRSNWTQFHLPVDQEKNQLKPLPTWLSFGPMRRWKTLSRNLRNQFSRRKTYLSATIGISCDTLCNYAHVGMADSKLRLKHTTNLWGSWAGGSSRSGARVQILQWAVAEIWTKRQNTSGINGWLCECQTSYFLRMKQIQQKIVNLLPTVQQIGPFPEMKWNQ